jgi:signal peptidase I
VNLERDHERILAAQTARAEAEAEAILRAALEKAAMLQVEMSKEIEAQTRRRISSTEHEIAERLAGAEREAEARVRQSVDTAATVMLNARKEADKLHEELAAAARADAEAIRAESLRVPDGPDPSPDEAGQAAERLSEADELAERRVAEAVEWSKQHIAEADEIGTRRILEAEAQALRILEQARAEAAALAPVTEPAAAPDWAGSESRVVGEDVVAQTSPSSADDHDEAVVVPSDGRRRYPRLGKTTRVVLLVIVTVVGTDLIRSCVGEPYTVASTSMEPEFHDGDRLVVNKLAYRWSDVGRGDIVVFDTSRVSEATHTLGDTLVKRVIGLPGEVVQSVDGRVTVDGEPLAESYLDGLDTPPFGPTEVPEDSVFVLGDDRHASVDSRSFGSVPIKAIQGRVDAVIWPPGHAGTV